MRRLLIVWRRGRYQSKTIDKTRYFSALFTIQSSSRLIDCRFLLTFSIEKQTIEWLRVSFLLEISTTDFVRKKKIFSLPPTEHFPFWRLFSCCFSSRRRKTRFSLVPFSHGDCMAYLRVGVSRMFVWSRFRRIGQPQKAFRSRAEAFPEYMMQIKGDPWCFIASTREFLRRRLELEEMLSLLRSFPRKQRQSNTLCTTTWNLYPVGVYFIWLGTWSHGEHFNVLCSIHTKML